MPSAEAISWELAEKVAIRVAGDEPLARSYHYASLQPDFVELAVEEVVQPDLSLIHI